MFPPPQMIMALANGEDDDMNAMKKVDDAYTKEHGEHHYWNAMMSRYKVMGAMNEDIGYGFGNEWAGLWYSLRLKFTDDTIRNEFKLFLNDELNYGKEVYGYKIYDIMKKYNIAYPVALLQIYELKCGGKDDTGFTLERKLVEWQYNMGSRIQNSRLNEDGTVTFLPRPVEKIPTQEELAAEYEKLDKEVEEIKKKLRDID